MYYTYMDNATYSLKTNDERYVTQNGFTPILTTNENKRYIFEEKDDAKKVAYENFLNVELTFIENEKKKNRFI